MSSQPFFFLVKGRELDRSYRTQSETMWEWPCRLRFGYPYAVSSRVKFQMIRDLSRLADRSIFGLIACQKLMHSFITVGIFFYPYFSSDVAKLVTQPLWPSRVPRRISCSAMMCRLELEVCIYSRKTSRLGGGKGSNGEQSGCAFLPRACQIGGVS